MTQINTQTEWITAADLGQRWKKSRSTIYRIRKEKAVPFYMIGGTVRIKLADVLEYERQAVG